MKIINHLHVNAQKEVLKLFEDFATKNNQVIYTTHSPFMIYEDKPYRTRLIIKDDKGNSNIGNKYYSLPHKMGSKTETLTPLLTAMGMNMNYNILSINNEKDNVIIYRLYKLSNVIRWFERNSRFYS